MENQFDLILVYTSFRRHEHMVNICKYLGSEFKIGIYIFADIEPSDQMEKLYLDLCLKNGAKVINSKAQCKCLLLPRFGKGYKDRMFTSIPANIVYKNLFYITDSFISGVPYLDEICKFLGKPIVLTPSKYYFGQAEPESKLRTKELAIDVLEVGSPYKKYPIFENLSIDYLLAYPSHVSVVSKAHEYKVVHDLYKTLKSIPKNKNVYVKVHNTRIDGNRLSYTFFNKKYIKWRYLLKPSLFLIDLFDFKIFKKPLYQLFPNRIIEILKKINNDYIFNRCINLLEKYPPLGIEQYLPFVKDGVITGLSNTIPLAVFSGVPVLNVDKNFDQADHNRKIIINAFDLQNKNGFSLLKNSNINVGADLIKVLKDYL
jgi:hypothetical protein